MRGAGGAAFVPNVRASPGPSVKTPCAYGTLISIADRRAQGGRELLLSAARLFSESENAPLLMCWCAVWSCGPSLALPLASLGREFLLCNGYVCEPCEAATAGLANHSLPIDPPAVVISGRVDPLAHNHSLALAVRALGADHRHHPAVVPIRCPRRPAWSGRFDRGRGRGRGLGVLDGSSLGSSLPGHHRSFR